MSTRSAIGYITPIGHVTAVYCHAEGQPEHQLPILLRKYKSKPRVKALLKPGSISSLETDQFWDSDTVREPQPLYHQERGDGPWNKDGATPYSQPPRTSTSLDDAKALWKRRGCEHLYLLRPGYGWQHYPLNRV